MKLTRYLCAYVTAFRNVLLGGNLASLLLLKRPKDMLFYVTHSLFLFRSLSNRRKLPQKNVFEVLPGAENIESIKLGNLHATTWFSATSIASDVASLCLICRIIRPSVIFEIGTLNGYTALHLALNSPGHARVYTLDLPDATAAPKLNTTVIDDGLIDWSVKIDRHCFESTEAASKITCLRGDSATFDFSPYHNGVDFFFIDGAHSYEYVRSDTLNALKCCRPGGVIAWHDYGQMGLSGVDSYLHELARLGRKIYSIPAGSLAFMIVPDESGRRQSGDQA